MLRSDKTLRVNFGLEIYVKRTGIGVVFGHASKVIYCTIAALLDLFDGPSIWESKKLTVFEVSLARLKTAQLP